MKKVVSSDMVAHIWAQRIDNPQGQDEARNSTSSVSFRGDKIFSYSTLMGEILRQGPRTLVALNLASFSITTSGHQSTIAQAQSGDRVILPDGAVRRGDSYFIPADLLGLYEAEFKDCVKKSAKARQRKDYYLSQANEVLYNAEKLAKFYNSKGDYKGWLPKIKKLRSFDPSGLIKAEKEQRTKELAEQKIKDQRLLKYVETAYSLILSNDQNKLRLFRAELQYNDINLFRVLDLVGKKYGDLFTIKDEQTVITTRRAEFPITHAIKAWKYIKPLLTSGQSWARNGHEIRCGAFMVDRIDDNGNLFAGCHKFKKEELLRFGAILENIPLVKAFTKEEN